MTEILIVAARADGLSTMGIVNPDGYPGGAEAALASLTRSLERRQGKGEIHAYTIDVFNPSISQHEVAAWLAALQSEQAEKPDPSQDEKRES